MSYKKKDKKEIANLEDSLVFVDTIAKTQDVMRQFEGKEIRQSYSGGSDSDSVAWLLRYLGYNVKMIFYDTGLEYEATWKHLDYMNSQGFNIEVVKANKSIPWTIAKYGKPFVNKNVTSMASRLQSKDFKFKEHGNLPYEELLKLYPNSMSALKWWTDNNNSKKNNISWNKGLKQFLIDNDGVPYQLSASCCHYAKKLPSMQYAKENKIDLFMLGIRKAEGGKRAIAYPSCFIPSNTRHNYSLFFPLFWWTNKDKEDFDRIMNIKHSDCYDVYGMKRTGCPGCPFGRQFEDELQSIEKYEPKLTKAVHHLFDESYDYMRKYREFKNALPPTHYT